MSLESFQAALVLGACGEALGSMNGEWGRYSSANVKHKIVSDLGGLGNIDVSDISWAVEEGTILHLSSCEALASGKSGKSYLHELATNYVDCMGSSMGDKRPSTVLLQSTSHLRPAEPDGCLQPFNHNATDGRAALRGICVGLRFHKPNNIEQLIATSIETTRMTHHNPIAYLGALTSALFTSYAIQGREVREWGAGLLHILPIALGYIVSAGYDLEANQLAWNDFGRAWEPYIQMRGIVDGQSKPKFPRKYGAQRRDDIYNQFAAPGKPAGSWGHDAPLIAYDALMSCGGSWEELCNHAMFHGGDGRGSGAIAASWYGVIYGFAGVPSSNHTQVIGCDIQSDRLKLMREQFIEDSSIRGTFEPFTCDLAKEDEIIKMFEHIKNDHGAVDVCINSAAHSRNGPTLLDGNTADWQSMLDINVLALSICTREAVRQMRENGIDDGHVIHIGSGACHQVCPRPTLHFYSGTKFMVKALAEGLRQELREINSHIRISLICPPMVRTPFSYQILPNDPGTVDEWYAKDPIIEPEDVADALVYALQAPPHVQIHDIIMTANQAIPK